MGRQKKKTQIEDPSTTELWTQTEAELNKSLELYAVLYNFSEISDTRPKKLLFLDLIIKLVILKAYVNAQVSKKITAQRMLAQVKDLLRKVETGELSILFDLKERMNVPVIPFEILKQKYLLHKGMLAISFEFYDEAVSDFVLCLNFGS